MSDVVEDTPTTAQKFLAELIGTFVLVFFGCGAAIGSGLTGSRIFSQGLGPGQLSGYVTTGLTFGLTVVVMAYAVGRISGGHFNPAVTVGAAVAGRLPWLTGLVYIAAQVLGGIIAAATLFAVLSGFDTFVREGGMAQNGFGDQGSGIAAWAAFLVEFVGTAIFLWVVLGATDERNSPNVALAPLAIGLALAMIHFASMFATGTSVNPARSIGPALFAGVDHVLQLWLFILAPLLGGLFAGVTYSLMFGRGAAPVPGSGLGGGPRQRVAYAPGTFEGQWNPGEAGGWNQPQAPWGAPAAPAPAPQQWGAPPPQQQAPGQWGAVPQQQPPGQWGAPAAPAPGTPPYGSQPGHWGDPDGDDDGRTQVRRPD